MSCVMRVATMLALLVTLAACGAQQAVKGPFADFPNRHSDFDYKLGWQAVRTDRGIAIYGLLKNHRYAYVDSLDLSVWLVDRNDRVLARETTFPIPQQIRDYEYRPFTVTINNVAPKEGDTYRFVLRYSVGGEGGFTWLSSFAVDASTGAVITRKQVKTPDDW